METAHLSADGLLVLSPKPDLKQVRESVRTASGPATVLLPDVGWGGMLKPLAAPGSRQVGHRQPLSPSPFQGWSQPLQLSEPQRPSWEKCPVSLLCLSGLAPWHLWVPVGGRKSPQVRLAGAMT